MPPPFAIFSKKHGGSHYHGSKFSIEKKTFFYCKSKKIFAFGERQGGVILQRGSFYSISCVRSIIKSSTRQQIIEKNKKFAKQSMSPENKKRLRSVTEVRGSQPGDVFYRRPVQNSWLWSISNICIQVHDFDWDVSPCFT